uniref:Uncharacterized protein n=1 Tax=Oryza glumipatula TaxID=40148 RepID=A0A0D9ZHG5_9ORYZ
MAAMPRCSPPRRHAPWPPAGDRRSSSAPPLAVAEPPAVVPARAGRTSRHWRSPLLGCEREEEEEE